MSANTWNAAGTYTSVMTSELNSLANNSVAYASAIFDNTTALNTDAWFSINLGSVAPSATAPLLEVYLLPLNADGLTYGDAPSSVPGTQSTSIPSWAYKVATFSFRSSTTAAAQTGTVKMPTELPPMKFLVAVVNALGSALNASGNTLQISTNSVA